MELFSQQKNERNFFGGNIRDFITSKSPTRNNLRCYRHLLFTLEMHAEKPVCL
jgi:hypothetical protein